MVSAHNGFNHPFEIPDDVELDYSDDSVFAAIEQARLGDDSARERMILGYTKLVLSKVATWVTLFPQVSHLSDDMVSEGLLAVVKSVDVLIKEGDPDEGSPTAYVHTSIINNIGHFLEDEMTIRIPRTAEDGPTAIPVDDYDLAVPAHEDGALAAIDLMDSFEAACVTQQDRDILHLRIKGYTDQEIANQLGLCRSVVQLNRQEFIERVQRQEIES